MFVCVCFIPGFSDLNIAGSATAATHQDVAGSASQEAPERPRNVCHPLTTARQRKRRRGGRTSWDQGGARSGQERLDKALASFLTWQQSAEERLLSLEEARLERELQAEERREQREDRRAEQERQHELRLFSMLTGALVAGRQAAPPPTTVPTQVPPSHVTTAAPSVTSSSTLPLPRTSGARSVPSPETGAATLSASVKSCKMAQNVSAPEVSGRSPYLSKRGNSICQQQGVLQEAFIRYFMDKYHDTDNPDVSLCHVNTQLSDPIMIIYSPFPPPTLTGYNQHGHK